MSAVLTEISGNEAVDNPASPIAALVGFYPAFNAGDLDGLARNRLEGDEPSMSNPLGGLRRSWPDIRDGYARLFGGAPRVRVTFHDFTTHEDAREARWCRTKRSMRPPPTSKASAEPSSP